MSRQPCPSCPHPDPPCRRRASRATRGPHGVGALVACWHRPRPNTFRVIARHALRKGAHHPHASQRRRSAHMCLSSLSPSTPPLMASDQRTPLASPLSERAGDEPGALKDGSDDSVSVTSPRSLAVAGAWAPSTPFGRQEGSSTLLGCIGEKAVRILS